MTTTKQGNHFWLARHGEKQSELGDTNWRLTVTANGLREVAAVAKFLVGEQIKPRRVVCSPFPRCVATAGIYARAFGIQSLCVEPGLCEVLSSTVGAKGLTEPPKWTDEEILEHLRATGSASITIDVSYEPLVGQQALKLAKSPSDRSEINERVDSLAHAIISGQFRNDLLVTHGSPCYRLVRSLTIEKGYQEPQMGSVIELIQNESSGDTAVWGHISRTVMPDKVDVRVLSDKDQIPAAALFGSTMEMQLALRQHADEKGLDYTELKRNHEDIVFQLVRQPEVPKVEYRKRVEALQNSFSCTLTTPVLTPVIHVQSPEQAIRNAKLALDAGADGVFLINHGHALPVGSKLEIARGPDGNPAPCEAKVGEEGSIGHAQLKALSECYQAVREALGPDVWIGVNAIQLEPQHMFDWVARHVPSASALWIDDLPVEPAVIEWEVVGFGALAKKIAVRNLAWKKLEEQERAFHCLEQRRLSGWKGLVFGGVAYKYVPYRCHHNQDNQDAGAACQALLSHWGALASHFCDVLITSGGATGSPCPVGKLEAFHSSRPLAFSGGPPSGATVAQYSQAVDVVLAATAIGKGEPGSEMNFLELDADKVRTWLQAYRRKSNS